MKKPKPFQNLNLVARRLSGAIFLILAASPINFADAATPQLIAYQALLTDSAGAPINETVDIIFTLWDAPTEGNALWTETRTSYEIVDGKLSVLLGELTPLGDGLFSDTSRYLGVKVGGDDEISPRSRFSSVPYSYRIGTIDGSSGGNVAGAINISPDPFKDAGDVLTIVNSDGDMVLTAKVNAVGTATISIFDPVDSKEGPIEKVQINTDGITIFDSTGTDTTITLTAAGDIIGTGQIQMGENASSASATTVFGVNNTADGDTSTISGGTANTTSGDFATIGGGQNNNASGDYSYLGGGFGHNVSGNYAAIPGGNSNTAAGANSFAAGTNAHALHNGSFVWCDASGQSLASTRANQLSVRASGGFRFHSHHDDDDDDDKAAGVLLSPGNSAWSSLSNRAAKSDIRAINAEELLEKLSTVPITKWKYIAEESQADHIGPMSQDFYSAFGLGDDDNRISTIDADGVALAAIQALYKENQELKKRIEKLELLLNQR